MTTVRSRADDDGLPLAEWKRIDTLCSSFEAAWAAGERPDPARFLEGIQGPAGDRLFRELLAIDVETRRNRGEAPQAPEYRERFPDHTEAIDATFASMTKDGPTLPSLLARAPAAVEPWPPTDRPSARPGPTWHRPSSIRSLSRHSSRPVTKCSVSWAEAGWAWCISPARSR